MHYVYICGPGENESLRYSLRSLEKNMPRGKVWVVGYRPDWYQGNFIKIENINKNKFDNIKNCLKRVIKSRRISKNFILMNDDFFAIRKIKDIPIVHSGLLEDKIKEYYVLGYGSKYTKLLQQTLKDLRAAGIQNPLDYDVHFPLPINKKQLKKTIDKAYFPRSAYGNLANIGGIKNNDNKYYFRGPLKSRSPDLEDLNLVFVSTETESFNYLKTQYFNVLFDKPSKYECVPNGI
jgi:hypothetical protein